MKRIIIALLIGIGVSACAQQRAHHTIEKYIDAVNARPAQPIPPIPIFKPYRAFAYTGLKLRNPFRPIIRSESQGPNAYRVREPLEAFALDSLRIVGTISKGNKMWALIAAPDSAVYEVSIGNYLGQNSGQVTNISPMEVQLVETIPDSDGWRKRPTALRLKDPASK